LRSISTISRARTSSQRGIVLIIALVLAVLYFGLMQLLLIDSWRALNEAQRFRARIVAGTLAESGAELAAEQIFTRLHTTVPPTADFQGTTSGTMTIVNSQTGQFEITAQGTSIGTMTQGATVFIKGTINGTNIAIDSCEHTQ
jgi:Tfp pilus assembly protein PilX